MNFLLDAIVFLFGLTVGSFLNVCVFRMPRGESIVLPRSFCPRCRESIAWFDNVPLLSFLLLRGKCRRCGSSISPRYPLVELTTGLLFVAVHFFVLSARLRLFRETGIVLPLSLIPFFWYFAASLLALSVIDWEHYILPERLTYPLLAVGLGLAALVPDHFVLFQWSRPGPGPWSLWPSLRHSLFGLLAGGASLWAIRVLGKAALKKEAMGMGDVMMMAAVGAWLGWPMALLSIFLGALFAAVVGISLIVARRAQWGSKIPFGPYLALGSLLCLFWGKAILVWYLGWYVK